MRERLQTQMEAMCQKQREELNRYKVHVAELSAQLWSVGEKLLNEEQQKQEALERLQELQVTLEGDEVDQPTAPVVSRKMCKCVLRFLIKKKNYILKHARSRLIPR